MVFKILIVCILLCFLITYIYTQKKHININREEYNKYKQSLEQLISQETQLHDTVNQLENQIQQRTENLTSLNTQCDSIHNELAVLNKVEEEQQNRISKFDELYDNHAEKRREELEKQSSTLEKTSQNAFEKFFQILEHDYNTKVQEYDEQCRLLEETYANKQTDILAEIDKETQELEKIKATRASVIEALRREKEIQENISFYCLTLTPAEQGDIAVLETIKPKLNKPRVLSMLIWSTYFQKPLKALAANVLGTSQEVCGIYKITNIVSGECYIGQAVDIAKRWSDHAKCGLGIDTPSRNKLYAAMLEFGLTSFSWEVLEKCEPYLLDEKEAYYINLYDSVSFGYNSLKGTNLK